MVLIKSYGLWNVMTLGLRIVSLHLILDPNLRPKGHPISKTTTSMDNIAVYYLV